ncbi:hypothetical protein NX059_001872 [Plenodomus lindquistii]|nr:hypothetical protein NX059_001872 [Plenodomus lindquistii]
MSSFNATSSFNGTAIYPLHTQAILVPLFAFPSWILCLPSMTWHFSQGNIAAGSVITWIVLNNFYNAINPLIWPRDNIGKWSDGKIWCDIGIRIQIGSSVAIASSTVMIIRKLARVMDTNNMIVTSSRNSRFKEKVWEVVWCWGFPLLMILLFYVVQPIRYYIVGIRGCISGFDSSWPTIALYNVWAPITMFVATYYAVLLIYRLYRYRREFSRLISSRNTTKSRFIRLFILCMITVVVYTPYTLWLLMYSLRTFTADPYSWSRVHGPKFNTIIMVPALGNVGMDKWIQIATGYVIFFVYGTGADAHNLYKRMLVLLGLGRWFPSLYVVSSGSSTPASFVAARSWKGSVAGKARSLFRSKSGSGSETMSSTLDGTLDGTTVNESVRHDSIVPLQTIPIPTGATSARDTRISFFKRVFVHRKRSGDVLPLYSPHQHAARSLASITQIQTSTQTSSTGSASKAWMTDMQTPSRTAGMPAVQIARELRGSCCDHDDGEKEGKSGRDWA